MTEKKFVRFQTEIVNGVCPTCSEATILVAITQEFYRCINCGADMEQHINGKITYLPVMTSRNDGGVPFKEIISFGKENEEYYEKNKMYDATKASPPKSEHKYNTNMLQGYDQHNQYIGLDTPLDKLYNSSSEKSANPMDTNWGGIKYSREVVDSGAFDKRTRKGNTTT